VLFTTIRSSENQRQKSVLIAFGDAEKLYMLWQVRVAGLRSLVRVSRRLWPHLQYPVGAVKSSKADWLWFVLGIETLPQPEMKRTGISELMRTFMTYFTPTG